MAVGKETERLREEVHRDARASFDGAANYLAQWEHARGNDVAAHEFLTSIKTKSSRVVHNLAYLADVGREGFPPNIGVATDLYLQAGLAQSVFRVGLNIIMTIKPDSKTGMLDPAGADAAARGMKFLEAAANCGHTEAAFVAGVERARGCMHKIDDGGTTDHALVYLTQAAQSGVVYAYRELAMMHMARATAIRTEEIDVTKPGAADIFADREKRADGEYGRMHAVLHDGANDRDDAVCMETLGRVYMRGLGLAVNHQTALGWFDRAWARGSPNAGIEVARMNQRGIGMGVPNMGRAVRVFEELVHTHAFPPAMCDLALVVMRGHKKLVKADPVRYRDLLGQAIAAGYVPAIAYALVEKIYTKDDKDMTGEYKKFVAILAGAASTTHHPNQDIAHRALVRIGEIIVTPKADVKACAACQWMPGDDDDDAGGTGDNNNTDGASPVRHLMICSRCRKVAYCSTACQKRAFSTHKSFCRTYAVAVHESASDSGAEASSPSPSSADDTKD